LHRPFYGWIIVGVTFLIGFTESSAVQNLLSVFLKPMAQDFGWSRTAVTGAMALGSLGAGILSPLVGPILDRDGPRMVAFWSILLMSIGLVCTAFSNNIWQFYLFFGVGRMIAVGILSLLISVTISNWFFRKRGRALGIAWLGPRLGSIILPALCQFIILSLGWRMAWGMLGVMIFLVSGIPALLFLRKKPEDMGLLPDGDPPDPIRNRHEGAKTQTESKSSGERAEPMWTRVQALHTRAFWVLTMVHGLFFFSGAGTMFHIFPFLTDRGMNGITAVWVLSTIAASGAFGSLMWGILTERVRIRSLLVVNAFISGVIFLLFFWAIDFNIPPVVKNVIIFGLAALHGMLQGGRHPILDNIWAEFFGRSSLGSIYSIASPFRFVANACGPLFASLCFDILKGYTLPFYFFCFIYFLIGTISLLMKSPQHKLQEDQTNDYHR